MRSMSRGRRNPFVGPLSQELWEKAHSVPSAYHDTFDYHIYDRLYERFGAEQPRGGVVYKGAMKLLEAQDFAQCFHRFEIDTYGRGCVHNCAYCYAKSYLSIRRYWNEPIPFRSTSRPSARFSPRFLKRQSAANSEIFWNNAFPCGWDRCPMPLCGWTKPTV